MVGLLYAVLVGSLSPYAHCRLFYNTIRVLELLVHFPRWQMPEGASGDWHERESLNNNDVVTHGWQRE